MCEEAFKFYIFYHVIRPSREKTFYRLTSLRILSGLNLNKFSAIYDSLKQ